MDHDVQQRRLRAELEQEGISDVRVLEVIQNTPRDRFVPAEHQQHAYANDALPIGHAQTISQPYIVALMTQAAKLTGNETVLEIGTGSGYQAAVLSQLCRQVVTIERIAELAEPARQRLAELGDDNITFYIGDGTLGCPEHAPYDAILVTAAAPDIPQPLYQQLRDGGRLIIPVGSEISQELQRITKTESGPKIEKLCDCRFVKLIGEAGWQSEEWE
jgi:protein-L-isoaspartate(D-aspartate) O-methyltransferase